MRTGIFATYIKIQLEDIKSENIKNHFFIYCIKYSLTGVFSVRRMLHLIHLGNKVLGLRTLSRSG